MSLVINADDYYGKEAFSVIHQSLVSIADKGRATMVGYKLRNTVSEHGQVTRGICSINAIGQLSGVTETYKISLMPNGLILDIENDSVLDPQALVSMNFWGFTPWFFERADVYLSKSEDAAAS